MDVADPSDDLFITAVGLLKYFRPDEVRTLITVIRVTGLASRAAPLSSFVQRFRSPRLLSPS